VPVGLILSCRSPEHAHARNGFPRYADARVTRTWGTTESGKKGFAMLVVLVMSFILSLMLTTLMTVTYTLHADNRRAKAVLQERANDLPPGS